MFFWLVLLRLIYGPVYGSAALSQSCQVTDVKSLLEGCDRLMGLNVTSVGGTIVNDHNCDVLLPKQVFAEEPLFQFELADSVSVYCKINYCEVVTNFFTRTQLCFFSQQKKFYTLIMADPDAPPQIEGEFFMHLLKSNIPVREIIYFYFFCAMFLVMYVRNFKCNFFAIFTYHSDTCT